MISTQNAGQLLGMPFQKDRMEDMLKQADDMSTTIAIMQRMYGLMQQMVATTHRMVETTHDLEDTTNELRDHLADFQDFCRPISTIFIGNRTATTSLFAIRFRALFDALDGVDEITEKCTNLSKTSISWTRCCRRSYPIPADDRHHGKHADNDADDAQHHVRHDRLDGGIERQRDCHGKGIRSANNDESFYLPPEIFENEDFKRVLKIFLSPDGKAARLLISQKGDPVSPEGISRVEPIKDCRRGSAQGHPAGKQ